MIDFLDAQNAVDRLTNAAREAHADLYARMAAAMEAERQAGYIEGIIFGLQNGYSGLAAVLRDLTTGTETRADDVNVPVAARATEPEQQTGGTSMSDDSNAGNLGVALKEEARRHRRPAGYNEALLLKILRANADDGITLMDAIREAKQKHGEEIADSSARVTLKRLEQTGKAVQIDFRWFPEESASNFQAMRKSEEPNGVGPSGSSSDDTLGSSSP